MGTVYRDTRSGGVIWGIRYKDVDGRLRRERTDAANRTLARCILADRLNAVEKARLQGLSSVDELICPKPAMTLRKLSADYLNHVEAKCNPRTVRGYRDSLNNHILPKLGGLSVKEIDGDCLQTYHDARIVKGASASTVRHELAVLHGLFKLAIKKKLVQYNPVSLVDKPKLRNNIVRYLDPEEESRLLTFASEPLRSAILVSIHSGLRESELTNLTWNDVRFFERHLVIRNTKNKKDRTVPMSDTLMETLKHIPRTIDSPYVFTSPETRTRYDRFNNTAWRKVLDKAGIKDFRWHDLRHTFASRLAQAGVPLLTISELLGHSSVQMTSRYAHLAPNNLRDAVKTLDAPKKVEKSAHGSAQEENRLEKAVS